jgi:hypothetical protein
MFFISSHALLCYNLYTMRSILVHTGAWYARYERPLSSISLFGGFLFDILTLRRVDALWENIWIVGHLVIVAVCIIYIHSIDMGDDTGTDPARAHFWFVNILQFFFGGLLSTYLVFYFRSASLSASWPFILVLALAFIANESLKRHFVRLSFQISLLYLSIFSFMIYALPILLHRMGDMIFLLSGAVSLSLIGIFLYALRYFSRIDINHNRNMVFGSILGIFAVINIFYFTNIIPPIPLSLKDGGVYHSINKVSSGGYLVTEESLGWKRFYTLYDEVHTTPGAPVYVYSAIFSPVDLNLVVVHEWQHYSTTKERWETVSKVNLSVRGGREDGFRTYSLRSNLEEGKWRVSVKTSSGQTIGVIRFTRVPVAVSPATEVKIK